MGRKILSFLLVLLCLGLSGCQKPTVTQPGSSTAATQTKTEETKYTDATEYTEETQAPEPSPTPDDVPQITGFEWLPICDTSISLWKEPNSNKCIATIPKGETLILQAWQGKYALVTYNDLEGYVYSNRIQPKNADYFSENLQVLTPTHIYSYQKMQADMAELKELYPDLVSLSTIGKSENGVNIPAIKLGSSDAKYHVLIQAAIHGREHFTAWLAMALADHALFTNQLSSDICYHIIPMSNPDGIAISQSGQLNEYQQEIYRDDWSYGFTRSNMYNYAVQWKANAMGVDLNRNFPCGWEDSDTQESYSSEEFLGASPFSVTETQALRDYTLSYDFDVTISLHSHGSVLYYKYGNKREVNALSYDLALAVQQVTGYIPTANDNTTGAGYKDWAMQELEIPSLTVEIGNFETPLQEQDIYNTFERCKDLLPTIYDWITRK